MGSKNIKQIISGQNKLVASMALLVVVVIFLIVIIFSDPDSPLRFTSDEKLASFAALLSVASISIIAYHIYMVGTREERHASRLERYTKD